MSGLTPVTGSTGISVNSEFYAEFCSMTNLELNYFELLKPDGEVFGGAGTPDYDVTYGQYWARLIPRSSLTPGVTYTLDIDGRINDAGTVKALAIGSWTVTTAGTPSIEGIELYTGNNRYWQFEGNPILLLGAFEGAHNVFLYPDQPALGGDLTALMDEMVNAGGNYMRCVVDPGRAVRDVSISPFTGTPGNYNLDFYTSGVNSFWGKFTTFLDEAAARKIIVEIELWSPHDWEDSEWDVSPWNPSNNSNYTTGSSGLATSYSTYNDHPFGQTAPADPDYNGAQSNVIRGYQDAYIEHLLSISLQYDNVLYCMSNETKTNPEWGAYWIGVVNTEATAAGKTVYSSDMFDDGFNIQSSSRYDTMFADAATYPFCNISQVNQEKNVGGPEGHWDDLAHVYTETSGTPRPINNTKIYGDDNYSVSSGNQSIYTRYGNLAAVNAYWMNLIGGCASARFHRPTHGLGLDSTSKASMTATRMLQTKVNLWEMQADYTHSLLTNRRTFNDVGAGKTIIYQNDFENGWAGAGQGDIIFSGYCDPTGSDRQNPQSADGFSPSNGQYVLTTAQSRTGQYSALTVVDPDYSCWNNIVHDTLKIRSRMIMGEDFPDAILPDGEEYWLAFSIFIPTSNDITQNPPYVIMEGDNLRSSNSNFELLSSGDVLGPIVKGEWADFVRRIQLDSDGCGAFQEYWLNGVKKASGSITLDCGNPFRMKLGAYYGQYGANYDGPDGPIETSLPFETYNDNVKIAQVTGPSFDNDPFEYGEAFLSYEAGQQYALYLTRGAPVGLDLTAYGGSTFDVDWINIDTGQWGASTTQAGGGTPTITPPGSGAWVAAIVLQ